MQKSFTKKEINKIIKWDISERTICYPDFYIFLQIIKDGERIVY